MPTWLTIKDLITRMTAANELIRRAVIVDPTRRPAENAPRPIRSARRPAWCCVPVRTAPARLPCDRKDRLRSGRRLGYALDGTTGAPLWHVPLGLASPFVPQAVPGDGTAIAFDARFNDLVRFDAKTGALKWRLALGEPVGDPPLVLGNQLVQVLPSGKLLLIGLESGELRRPSTWAARWLGRRCTTNRASTFTCWAGRIACSCWRAIRSRAPRSIYLGHSTARSRAHRHGWAGSW